MTKPKKEIFVFVDFDGTIMLEDTTDVLFRAAGGFEENLALLKNKEINIFEYWHRFAEGLSEKFTPETLQEFVKQFEMDQYFPSFVEMLEFHSLPLAIISDNFTNIIQMVLDNYSLGDLKFFVNEMEYNNGKFIPTFNHASEGCEESFAAVCKRNIILNSIPDGALVVYVGDGFSDYGAADIADIIFAKSTLAKYCSENRIPHHQYKTFFDVKMILDKLLKENKIHSRYQAHLVRKRHFENE
jgi:2,3-diketo-5-methylthio-1-phosphopentane phosphatase